MESTPVMTSSASRLAPPLLHPRSSSRTRSPTRSSSRSHRLSDDLLSDLTPATTLQALTFPTGKLKASIEAASPADRAFAIRATLASKKVQEWLEELSNWPWPNTGGSAGFGAPASSKRIKLTPPQSNDQSEQQHEEGPEPQYCGSLSFEQVARYEYRLEEIGEGMDDLKVEEIKRQVLDTHFSGNSRLSSSPSIDMPSFLASYTVMDDFTAIVTATVLQALPNLAKLTRLMDIWGIRLSVLRRVPSLLLGLDDAEMALNSGWQAIKIPGTTTTDGQTGNTVLSRQTFEVMKNVLQAKVTILGRDLDYMLDILEGRMDTLPDSWLDRMESLERDYGEWVVSADRKITDGELAAIAPSRMAKKDMSQGEDAEAPVGADGKNANKNGEVQTPKAETAAREGSRVASTPAIKGGATEANTIHSEQEAAGISTKIISPSLDTQPIIQSISREPTYTPLTRSTSVRSVSRIPKFGHTFANALRRTMSNEESPKMQSLDSLATSPRTSLRPSSMILNKFPSPPLMSPERSELPRLRSSSSPLIGQERLSMDHSLKDGSVLGAPPSSIALAQQLGISASHENLDSGNLKAPAHLPNILFHLSTNSHTSTIASSDGASESVQSINPEGMEFDLLDAQIEARRPSIIVDSIHNNDTRDSDVSDDSLSDRCKSKTTPQVASSLADPDSDDASTVTFEDSPLPPGKWSHDLQQYDKTPPGSPPGAPRRSVRRPPQLLESPDFSHLISTPEDSFLQSIPASPVNGSSDDQMQQQISSLLQSIPAHIRLRSEPEEKSNPKGIRPPKTRRSVTPSMPAVRSQSSIGSLRTPTPSFTLAPAYAKTSTPRQRAQNGHPEIKVYHLSCSSGEKPIKLFVRLVGENGERVMVRVGGGWADLGEYLKEYASHHGRRAPVDTDKVEVQDLPSRISSGGSTIRDNGRNTPGSGRTTPGPRSASAMGVRPSTAVDRPKSSLGIRKTRKSTFSTSDGVPPLPATPFAEIQRGREGNNTPPSAASRSSSRLDWNEEDASLGLAGPRGKQKELDQKDLEWVEGMKEKVMMASAEKEKEKRKGGHRQSLGEMDKVGATKRLFRQTSRLEL
ncbi:31b56d8d-dcbd-4587-a74d-aad772c495a4-CDS [Sclerotinia trifoliorum]|uniref:31b56d8d-dcbd-4587-a74d-aad772c495a4-CDS n=1 Tax=Sclerotinia trifoliorum TaxID=28548 RepID=A0A8H2ZL87_9HELO|nr:31b56d8d-dcbd-4587-a74d-aad772c495a4-CDS [Sclerotinia trifoliorum]